MPLVDNTSFVEIEVFLCSLYHDFVCLVEVLLRHDISVLTHCLHTCFLADRRNICTTNCVRSTHV